MFVNTQVLDVKEHQHLRFSAAKNYAFARVLRQAPLALAEALPASLCFPVLFTADESLTLVALLGKENNMFVDTQNRWSASYVPVHIQRYPFVLGQVKGSADYMVMADLDAPHFEQKEGTPLFSETGEIHDSLKPVVQLMLEFEAGRQASLLQSIQDAGILVARDLYKSADGKKQLLGKYQVVDQQKLNALDDATLAAWVRSGLMSLIDAHLLSLRHLKVMLETSA